MLSNNQSERREANLRYLADCLRGVVKYKRDTGEDYAAYANWLDILEGRIDAPGEGQVWSDAKQPGVPAWNGSDAVGLAADLKVFVDKCQNESLYTALCKSPMGSQNNSFQHEWPSHLKAVNGNGEPSTPVALFERSSLCLEALGKRDEELRAEAERLHAIEEHAREILSDPNIPDRERSLIGMILWQDGHRKDECRYENGCPLRHGR